jgi:sugar O-acyltransferase (sialic acid O-acetyltransferase NeuD family)
MDADTYKSVLIGAGALARDIVSVAGVDRFAATYVDPGYPAAPIAGLPVITDWSEALHYSPYYALAVLDAEHRIRACRSAERAGLKPCPPIIHHTAQVAAGVILSPGCMVGYYSILGPGVLVRENTMIMHSATVSHDTAIGENSVILHGACIGGYAQIGRNCFVGANSVVSPGVSIGDDSFVAAGAVCFKDAPAGSMLLGNPARISLRSSEKS